MIKLTWPYTPPVVGFAPMTRAQDRRGMGVTGWLQVATLGITVAGGVFALGSAKADLANAVGEIGELRKALVDFAKESRASAATQETELARHAVRLEMIERDRRGQRQGMGSP